MEQMVPKGVSLKKKHTIQFLNEVDPSSGDTSGTIKIATLQRGPSLSELKEKLSGGLETNEIEAHSDCQLDAKRVLVESDPVES